MKRIIHFIIMAAVLSACAARIPPEIREAPPGSPSAEQVQGHVKQFLGSKVRWGGSIAEVDNRATESVLEIVSRPLESNGRPAEEGPSSGRFLARYSGFLDPMVYTKGSAITVVGIIDGEEQRPIGKFVYDFPVVKIESHYQWPPMASPRAYPPPYWDDPWWPYPWYYRYRHPYWW